MVNANNQPQISHLFRPLNLGLIVVLMYILRWGLLAPLLKWVSDLVVMPVTSQITEPWFALLVISIVLIAAGGYILNDIKDQTADAINHGKNPVGTKITEANATLLYQITTVAGTLLGFVIGIKLNNYNLGILHLTAAVSLWFYANYFKKQFLTGNLMVAFLVALVPLTTGIFEVTQLQINYFNKISNYEGFNFNFIAYWFIGYAAFAFLFTFIREIIKDLEDVKGDMQTGAQTLPIVWGTKKTNIIITALYVFAIASIHHMVYHYLNDKISLSFALVIDALITLSIFQVWANKQIIFSASNWNKVISIIGMLYLLGVGYMMSNQTIYL